MNDLARRTLLLVPLLLALAAPTPAQEGAPPPAPAPAEVVKRALAVLGGEETTVLSGRVSEVGPADAGLAGGMVVMSPGGSAGEPFAGAVEIAVAPRETFVASRASLPGFAVLSADGIRLTRTTVEDEPLDVSDLRTDLLALLDARRLTTAAAQASWSAEHSEQREQREQPEGGVRFFEAELGKRIVPKRSASVLSMMAPRVMKVTARVGVTEDGRLRSMRFTVVRSDPMAAMRRRAMDGELDGATFLSPEDMAGDDDLEEGKSHVYDLTVAKPKLSERAEAALEAMRKVAHENL